MIRSFLSAFTFLTALTSTAQTTLFTEDFEGPSPAFTLNTTDAGSVISAWNTWVINNSYTGGNGDLICLGFPFAYTIVNTPAQPLGISTPNGNYLHTASVEGIADGITCCSFGAADPFCISADNTFSRMNNDVSTVGYTDVDFNFWWVCEGGASYYGQVYYSTNGGASWTATTGPSQYNFQGSWTQQTVSLPAFGNQATLRFGFRFVNSVGTGALDPGFAIDDVAIVAQTTSTNTIATSVPQQIYCPGSAITVTCTATGTFNAGNVFTAQLSDALGSFASPTVIGSIAATSSVVFNGTIPLATPAGANYQVRVVSSNPVVVGSASAAFSVNEVPQAGADAMTAVCGGALLDLGTLLTGADPGGTWIDQSATGQLSGSVLNTAPLLSGTYDFAYLVWNTCGADTAQITVVLTASAYAGMDAAVTICKATGLYNLFNYLGGTPAPGGSWFNPVWTPVSGVFNSASNPGGNYTYVQAGSGGCPSDSAVVNVTLVDQANAGSGGSATLCGSAPPTPLIGLLGGSPDLTGYWLDPAGFVTNASFEPGIDAPGNYTYVVVPPLPCPNDTAEVSITVQPQPDAGTGGSFTICTNVPPFDLITLLGGTPDTSGTWTGPGGGTIGSIVDPGTAGSGLYVYTVDGAPACPDDDASLAIIFDPCSGVEEVESAPIRWLGQDHAGEHAFALGSAVVRGWQLHDALGRAIPAVVAQRGDRLLLSLPATDGVYLLSLATDRGGVVLRFAHARR